MAIREDIAVCNEHFFVFLCHSFFLFQNVKMSNKRQKTDHVPIVEVHYPIDIFQYLLQLPDDVLRIIISSLSRMQLIQIRRTCKRLNILAQPFLDQFLHKEMRDFCEVFIEEIPLDFKKDGQEKCDCFERYQVISDNQITCSISTPKNSKLIYFCVTDTSHMKLLPLMYSQDPEIIYNCKTVALFRSKSDATFKEYQLSTERLRSVIYLTRLLPNIIFLSPPLDFILKFMNGTHRFCFSMNIENEKSISMKIGVFIHANVVGRIKLRRSHGQILEFDNNPSKINEKTGYGLSPLIVEHTLDQYILWKLFQKVEASNFRRPSESIE